MWLRLRWQNLSSELLLFEQSVNLKTFVVVISVLALRCSSCYNLSSQPELYLPFRTLIQDLHIKAICILKISSPNFHVIIYCIYMMKIEQIRKTPCLSLHVIESSYTLNTWEMYIESNFDVLIHVHDFPMPFQKIPVARLAGKALGQQF